jgi:hypothetical protein
MRIVIFTVRFMFILLFFLVITNLYTTVAYARQRVALVIGNGNYQNAPLLTTSINDAKDMAVALRKVGFDVILKTNIDQSDMEDAMVAFGEKLRWGVVGIFYYSGYAVQYEGENYLIPYNAISSIKVARHIRTKAVSLDYVLSLMEKAENGINIVILDACRSSPFSFSKTIKKGLTTVSGAENMVITYATSPGKVVPLPSRNRKKRNSFYTKHLLRFIKNSDLHIELMLKKVRAAVKSETDERQKPWYISSLDDDFKFNESITRKKPQEEDQPIPVEPVVKKVILKVLSNAEGATVVIDGKKNYCCIKNGRMNVKLSLGWHTVQLKRNSYVVKKEVNINQRKQKLRINFSVPTVRPNVNKAKEAILKKARLIMTSNVDGATVFIEKMYGSFLQKTKKMENKRVEVKLPVGWYRVQVEKSGYTTKNKKINLVSNKSGMQSMGFILIPFK